MESAELQDDMSSKHLPPDADYLATVRRFTQDHATQWSAGTFGAIAEFLRDDDEDVAIQMQDGMVSAATARGAVQLIEHPDARFVAYETVSRDPKSWRHSVALCLPTAACGLHVRRVVTELGPDAQAVRASDRGALLFDLGLALPQTDACIRTSDPELIAAMRRSEGLALFDHDNPVLMDILRCGPHRVFVSRLGRVEVFQPIPPPTGKSPLGPHTHILPKLLRTQRTHAATVPIPQGWVPCVNFYPPHPLLDAEGMPIAFVATRFDAFNGLMRRYGNENLVALGLDVERAVTRGDTPGSLAVPSSKFARAALRVCLRKLKASGLSSSALDTWLAHYDLRTKDDGEEDSQHAC